MGILQENEKIILNELRENSRSSLLKIAHRINAPVSTVYEKVKGYEKDGLIRKHTSLLNFCHLGYFSRIIVAIKVKKENRESIRSFLRTHPSVNTLYKINNGFDYLVEIVSPNSNVTQDILEELDSQAGMIERKFFEILDELKREAFELK